MPRYLRRLPVLLMLGCWPLFGARVCGQTWVEDRFEDFADGRLDASGQNLYVSRNGSVRTIHRFDLNQDGYVDLIFNSTHDTRTSVPATLGTVGQGRRARSARLAVEGSTRVELADLNRDGWLDAVFCPNDTGFQHPRAFVTVLWGGADGWPARRANGILPVHGATDLAVVDLNADAWPDIAVLCGERWRPEQPDGRMVRVYWGGQRGFLLTRRTDLGVPRALALAAGDLDGDGAGDLAVLKADGHVALGWSGAAMEEMTDTGKILPGAQCLTAADVNGDGHVDLIAGTGDGNLHVLAGSEGRAWTAVRTTAAPPASHIAAGDLDGDGQTDLVLTDFTQARAAGGEAAGADARSGAFAVLWGDGGAFNPERSTAVPVQHAFATVVGDIDGDTRDDLLVAVHQGSQSFAATSVVFFGTESRDLERGSGGWETEGATDVAIAPREQGLPPRVVFANSLGGMVGENVPLHVYWGGRDGFESGRRLEIPFRSGYEATSADFNVDGFVDLVAINSQHAGATAQDDPYRGANIFWGGADGFDFETRRSVLQEHLLGTSNTADLNRDGYLDLVLGVFDAVEADVPTPLVIYYGSDQGFQQQRRATLPCEGRSIGSCLADFNRDGWLDIAVSSTYLDRVRIFWGSSDGFDASRQAQLDVPYPIGLETADLNADGHLDLVVGSYYDSATQEHDTGTMIFWGSDAGFRPWDAQRLPGWSPVGPCVADFDGDGHLDLFTPHYLAERMRASLPCYLFWGGPEGFSPRRKTTLVCDSAHDALAGDFDRDGRLDLAVSCHSQDGDHRTVSRVFYNDGERFAHPRVQLLPTHGTHWMWCQDMGHIYDRKWRQQYESSVFSFAAPAREAALRFTAEVPEGSKLTFAVRSGATENGMARAAWRSVEAGRFSLGLDDRYLQYRATFESDNGDRYPVLDRVEIELAGR